MATTNAALSAISDYWNLRAEGYSLRTRDELESDAGRRLTTLFSEYLPLPEGGGRLLDVGCGPGIFSISAAKLGWSVTGIDLSQRMLDEARSNAAAVGRPALFQIGNAEAPDFPPESFDAIVNRYLLWNLPHPEEALAAWWRLLKPGGVILVSDGNHYLHLFDETYRRVEALKAPPPGHAPKYVGDVDTTPMLEIAKTLPLSSVYRPEWDRKTVETLGGTFSLLETSKAVVTDPDTGEMLSVVDGFIWMALKLP